MLWPHTKTNIPSEAGFEIFVETWNLPPVNQQAFLTTNSVSCTITTPLFGKLQELRPLDDLKISGARLRRHKFH